MAIEPTFVPGQASTGAASLAPSPPDASRAGAHLWGADELSFWDLLDVVNPLQHIPIVSTLYRELTGDGIGAVGRLAGGVLFGGIPGLASAVVNVMLEDSTGKDMGENVLALFEGDDSGATSLAEKKGPAAPIRQGAASSGRLLVQLAPEARAAAVAAQPTTLALAESDPGTAAPGTALAPAPGGPEIRNALEAYERGSRALLLPARAALAQRA